MESNNSFLNHSWSVFSFIDAVILIINISKFSYLIIMQELKMRRNIFYVQHTKYLNET